jgi:hypothetical protein
VNLRPGRPLLAFAGWHTLDAGGKVFAGAPAEQTFFFFVMYLADFTVCRKGLLVKLYGFPLIPTHSSTIHSR